ncbi:MAG: hypothetical protein OXG35_11415 [Acidobacteria bacterium]|nr:hypothetical protein [Acidobacteriota bacterium]
MHSLTIVEDPHCSGGWYITDTRNKRGAMYGPFRRENDRASIKAAADALNLAAAAYALQTCAMSDVCTPEEVLDETFGADDPDERQRRADQYMLYGSPLLDGAEESIIALVRENDEDLEEHYELACTDCDDRWTGTEGADCYNCHLRAEAEAEAAAEAA